MYDNIQWMKRYGPNGQGESITDDTHVELIEFEFYVKHSRHKKLNQTPNK